MIFIQIATLIKAKNNRSGLGTGLQPTVLKFLDVMPVYYYINAISTASVIIREIMGSVPIIPFISYIQEPLVGVGGTIKIFMTIF